MIPNINLLPKLEKERTVPVGIIAVMIAFVAIVLAVFIFQYFGAKSELTKLSAQQTELTAQRDQVKKQLTDLQNKTKGSLAQSVKYVENVSYYVTPLITETNTLLPAHAFLRSYTFSKENVVIIVDFETMSSVSDYVEKLLASPYFTDIQLGSVSNFEVGTTQENANKFTNVPRYTADITLTIDKPYLASTGGEQ